MDTPGLISLRHVSNNVLMLTNFDNKFREKITQIVINGLKKLNIFFTKTYRTVELDVNIDTNTVTLPKDYIDYIQVYIIVNNKIHTLTRCDEIPLPRTEDCGVDTNEHIDIIKQTNPDDISINDLVINGIIEHHYGTSGAENSSYYKIDRERGLIILQGRVTNNLIYLDYVSTGVSMDEQTLIPQECEETLITYTIWQMINFDPRVPQNDKIEKERQYKEALKLLIVFQNSFDIDEFKDAMYKNSRQTPSR